jgi:energy-coupling factor transporter transmembrane protein EcfT
MMLLSYHSAPGALYLFLAFWFLVLVVWSFALSYFPKKAWKRDLGFVLSFMPSAIIVGAFLFDLAFFPQPWQDLSYILSTLTYQFTYYFLPSIIGYLTGFLFMIIKEREVSRIEEDKN